MRRRIFTLTRWKMIKVLRTSFLALLSGSLIGCSDPAERSSMSMPADIDCTSWLSVVLVKSPPSFWSQGGCGIGWQNTRKQIARFAQVVTYDRAGIGPVRAGSRAARCADDCPRPHAALQRAGVKPPYVLVGPVAGGLYVQVFAAEYPEETAGLVWSIRPCSTDLCLSMDESKHGT